MRKTSPANAVEIEVTPSHWNKVRRSLLAAFVIVSLSLAIGVAGYHHYGQLSWVDSFLEASMILGGMGPVATLKTDAVKIFASCYALFSGLMLISTTGFLMAPWLQRLLYATHRDVVAEREARSGK
jgi:hypothetical protein